MSGFVPTDEDLDLQDPLPVEPRQFGKHDLPPKWDGITIEWRGWEGPQWTSAQFHQSWQEDRCQFCGGDKQASMNLGYACDPPTPAGIKRKAMRWWAFRCPDCRGDVVHDLATDEWWTLDSTDYDDQGSDRPV